MVQLQNGCICCTLRTDLVREIKNIYDRQCFDCIVIESTGIAEPMQVAESFELDSTTFELTKGDTSLSKIAKLDTCVTVIDVSTFADLMRTSETAKERFDEGDGDEGEKKIGNLIIEQIEFADVILLNKADLVEQAQLDEVANIISRLNPSARVSSCANGDVDISLVVKTGLYSREKAEAAPGWLADLQPGAPPHVPETLEFGISSYVYRARRPFHPQRLKVFIDGLFHLETWGESVQSARAPTESMKLPATSPYGWIVRSKGFCWLASHDSMVEWSQGGYILQLLPAGDWYVDQPVSARRDLPAQVRAKVEADFQGEFGDKRQEIVFIGVHLRPEKIDEALLTCLLTDEEMTLSATAWRAMSNDYFSVSVSAGTWTEVVQVSGTKRITIDAGMQLVLKNIALEWSQSHGITAQVFLNNDGSRCLFATLRSGICDQFCGEYVLENTSCTIEVVPIGSSTDDSFDISSALIHLSGVVVLVEDEESDEHDHDHEKDDH